jgi:hypothetical protein
MKHRMKLTATVTLALLACSAISAHAFPIGKKKEVIVGADSMPLTPAQSALIDKAIAREAAVIKTLKTRQPLVETYIQNMHADPVMGQSPTSDLHFIGRICSFGSEGHWRRWIQVQASVQHAGRYQLWPAPLVPRGWLRCHAGDRQQ